MNSSGFSDALKVLIILSKPKWSSDELSFLSKNSDQGMLVYRLSERHRVTPLIWSSLLQLDLFSEACRTRFKLSAYQNQLQALQAKALQTKLLSIQDVLGFSGFFLKGIQIAERYYSDIAQRHVLDLDWFVEEDRIGELTEKLMAMGYTPFPAINTFNSAQWKYFKSTHHDIYFSPPSNKSNLSIELHWRLRSSWGVFKLTPHGYLNELDEFLYLCVHGTEHGWFRLKWLADLPRIIEKNGIDWAKVWKRSEELNCQKHLSITLLVLDKLSLFAFPGELQKLINPQEYDFQLGYIQRVISADSTFNENDKNRLAYFKYLWSFRGDDWNLSFIKQFLTSPADWKTIRLPEALFPLYFFLRPFIWTYRRLTSQRDSL